MDRGISVSLIHSYSFELIRSRNSNNKTKLCKKNKKKKTNIFKGILIISGSGIPSPIGLPP